MRDSFLNGARSVAHQGRRYPCGVRSTHCIGGPYGGNRLNEYGHRQSSLDIEVRQKLAAYLRSELAFPKFKKWFIARTWDVESQGNGNDVELAHSIHIRLIEFSNGDWTEDELKGMLRPVFEAYRSYGESPYIESPESVLILGRTEIQ
jgi:hypothetical protein